MMTDYCFIYSLVYNQQVFYIGKCKDLASRYMAHIKGNSATATSMFITQILESGRLPEMNIIDYLPTKEAAQKEIEITNAFTMAGQPLTNSQNKRPILHHPTNAPLNPTKKQMIAILKYKQQKYIYCWSIWADRQNLKSIVFPQNPFI